MTRYAWLRAGDLNAFFGLMLDNVTVLILLTILITGTSAESYTVPFVLTRMIPGTALGVVIGDIAYTILAFRLAKRTGRGDVTAMPLGLDTPSTFAIGPLVLLPALHEGLTTLKLPHDQAMLFGWHVGAVVLVIVGLFKTLASPFGNAVRRWVPRAGLLGSLAAIALVLIAFLPLFKIAATPIVGIPCLVIILVTLVAHRPLPGKIPGALAALLLGIALYWMGSRLEPALDVPLVSSAADTVPSAATPGTDFSLDDLRHDSEWWGRVFLFALGTLPTMLPFALATIVGGLDCTESAAAAGDEYDTRSILLTEGLASLAAGLAGGVIQNTPYIGQPAYKAMGGRAGYTLATALFIGAAALFGWFGYFFEWIPAAAVFPILVFVGLEITSQSFHATPTKHYAAVALAILPALAKLILIVRPLGPSDIDARTLPLICLANGFIITGLLWASALAAIIDARMTRAACFLLICAACSAIGIIHSPLLPEAIAWPWDVTQQMANATAVQIQSPLHWAAAYALAALALFVLGWNSKVIQTSEK